MKDEDNVSLMFNSEDKHDEACSVFLLEDLVKEYNYKISMQPFSCTRYPLSLYSIDTVRGSPIMRAMTNKEIESMPFSALKPGDWMLIKNAVSKQFTAAGIIGNIPNIAEGVNIVEMVNEIGLKGKVYYKKVKNKTYVILKGYAGDRSILKGTRYLNTHPEIVRLGLAKVSIADLAKSGFKTSVYVYGFIKAAEAAELVFTDKELKPKFFYEMGTDIPKMAISSAVAAAAGGAALVIGFPVAVTAAVVLVVSVASSIALDYLDEKTGLTDKLSESADTMWKKLKEAWNSSPTPLSMRNDLFPEGMIF